MRQGGRQRRFDIAVVGAGMVGAAAAALLARSGFSVAVVQNREPEPFDGAGPVGLRVSALSPGSADILGSEADREAFSEYVHANFTISDQQGRRLPLRPVGYEIEGRFLWVYAETAIPEHAGSLSLNHSTLIEMWPEQINLVNVERNGTVRSIVFTQGIGEITVDLE